ncbi:hypothetical protein LN042_04825 [Kitasatospora sp. RB6PN24]|uniref:hypothetical protein n=1 Tax=Kitasatospora humi TaxID=2893891 RepID=UPI001E57761D|nr:hypothetical protein [Kitasatospora humi]MCC9306439.1 hypothetical protein [Kitasatospora humi]
MTISGESWAVESGEEHLRGQERAVRAVFEELDFQVYGVDRSGRGARGVPPAAGGPTAVDSDALSDYEMLGDEVSWFEVRSGDWSSLDGPYVTVRTYQPGIERYTALPEPEELIERERDRIYEYLGLDEGDCPSRIRTLREWITVDGEPVPVQIHEERGSGPGPGGQSRTVWAGRLTVDGSVVLLCGRGVAPGDVELDQLSGPDYDRYLTGRTELLRQLETGRQARIAQARRGQAALTGLDAHRLLAESSVERALAERAHRLSDGRVRLPRRLRVGEPVEHWSAAVRQQMHYASETRSEARTALELMVGQLCRLADQVDWLVGSQEGRAAVEETIRHTVFASQVPSLPAQQAWVRVRECGGDPEAEACWLAAWDVWRRQRRR